jgi:hypothetical protein
MHYIFHFGQIGPLSKVHERDRRRLLRLRPRESRNIPLSAKIYRVISQTSALWPTIQ